MATDLYSPITFFDGAAGGTPLNSVRLNLIAGPDGGIEKLDRAQGDVAERLDALEAAVAGQLGRARQGPSTARGFPTDGFQFYDETLDKPLWGDGTAWRDSAGTAVAGSGGAGGPTNFTATVNPDSSISLSWTLPTPPGGRTITGVTVREKFKSPAGVSGMPLAGSATSNTRPASTTTAVREYYVTCTFSGGSESAESNHATVYLPYGTAPPDDGSTGGGTVGGGGGGAGSPAAGLALGALPKVGGRYNLGVGRESGHVDIAVATLEAGYVEEDFFFRNTAGDGTVFRAHVDGGRTSTNTKYPRTELREYRQNGTDKATWNASSGSHVFEYQWSCGHLPPTKPWVTIGQIHDASSDAQACKLKGDTRTALDYVAVFYDTDHPTKLLTGYDATAGDSATRVSVKVDVSGGGTCKIYINGVLKITSTAMSGKGAGHYWKLGAYLQTGGALNNNPANEYGDVTVYDATQKITHNPTH